MYGKGPIAVSIFSFQFNMVLVYFVYGLAFFAMGLALTLEMGRSPRLAEKHLLRPLAVFGLMHGGHEWLEIFMTQAAWFGAPFPVWLEWTRVGILAISFIPLLIFGILGFKPFNRLQRLEIVASIALLSVCMLLVMITIQYELVLGDALSRYVLAVPGGILAGVALYQRSRQLRSEGKPILAQRFLWSALGFVGYGLTQIFVPAADIYPARLINSALFLNVVGLPIQVFRAMSAVLVMVNLLRAIQIVEREREDQLFFAQKERLEAMERVQQELVNREAMRRELLRHIVIAQEEERSRIARELHDETAQILTAFSLNLATLRETISKRSAAVPIIDRLQKLSRQMSYGIYRLVHDLRPAQLDDLGLVPALQHLGDEFYQRAGLKVKLLAPLHPQRLDPLIETVLFRIAQEALTNVQRHAQTTTASMYLTIENARVKLRVSDQGVGFNPDEELIPPHGWGLAGMRERAESVDGQLEIRSEMGKGSQIEITIPILQNGMPHYKEAGDGPNPDYVSG
jgi:signal transduction histidine kinase